MKIYYLVFILASFVALLPTTTSGIQWLSLSRLSSAAATVNPPAMCEKMKGSLIKKQINFCKKNPNFMDSVRLGAVRAIDECQYQFRTRRWNCSTLEDNVNEKFNAIKEHLNGIGKQDERFVQSSNVPPRPLTQDLRASNVRFKHSKSDYDLYNSPNSYVGKHSRRLQLYSGSDLRNVRRGRRLSRKARNGNDEEELVRDNDTSNQLRESLNSSLTSDDTTLTELSLLPESKKKSSGRAKNRKSNLFIGPYPVVSPGTREMAFVHAISSVGVAHALTRACSSGELENCGCDRSLRGMSPEGFQWSGCSDNVDFGITFSRTFVDARDRRKSRKQPGKAQPLMNLHNNEAGRKLLERNMKIECKCHGVSGSCELKTCWRSVASFRVIGEILKDKFDSAHEVYQKKKRGRRMLFPRFQKFKPHTDTDLVFLKDSSDYCDFDIKQGSLGTRGRECDPTNEGVNGCDIMCCNRGYTTKREKRVERCKCKFHWCCYVECEECIIEVQVNTCN